MEHSSKSMIRCVNRRDTRWIATWRRLSASWTPNQPQRPKQEENAATMGEKKVNGRKRQFWVDTNGAGAHYHMRAKRTCLSVTTTKRRKPHASARATTVLPLDPCIHLPGNAFMLVPTTVQMWCLQETLWQTINTLEYLRGLALDILQESLRLSPHEPAD